MNTKTIGNITEARVLAALLQAGFTVLLPFGGGQRYDMVTERDGSFKRVQCKTGRLKKGSIVVNGCSIQAPHLGGKRRNYHGGADYFGVYCPDTDGCYLIPVDGTPDSRFALRVAATKNNQSKRIRMASDYIIKRV